MKTSSVERIVGFITAVIAGGSLLVSLYALYQVWSLRQPFTENLGASLDLVTATLDTTSDTLVTFQQSLDLTSDNVDYLDRLANTIAQSIHDSTPVVDSLKTLTARDLPATLAATEKSLTSAQSSAKLIDDVLGSLSRIPLLPLAPYKPDVPLATSLAQVSSSLQTLSPSLASINSSLEIASGNLASLESQTRDLSRNIQQIKKNVAGIRQAAAKYQETTIVVRARMAVIKGALPSWITTGVLAISFILGWLMVTQIDLFLRGLRLLR